MRCLSLTQPWATLIALGAKKIETRSWATRYRGPLAIHAAKGLGPVGGMKGLVRQCMPSVFYRALLPVLPEHIRDLASPPAIAEHLPFGAIIAVCDLRDCVRTEYIASAGRATSVSWEGERTIWTLTDQERAFGDYSPGRFAWLLANIRPLATPIPATGALGLWTPPDAVAAQITAALGGT